ncbi:CotH kinase family protein [Anaerocolumna sp.]|uniref:CotH kinase family protein n=1 Tax=Anaerocolumna sp. TaxID=2041569 RepID=UPI0028AA4AC0|nr:CotH kinase family protein [Anaerocolumna sp.]
MSKHKFTTSFCVAIVIAMLAITITFMASPNFGVAIAHIQPAYAEKLFSTDRVHTIDIVVKESDWEDMIANAIKEEYIQCSVVIDNESVKNIGIRPKGNSSLSMIANSDSDRYSFKLEFDHYEKGKNYFGLDKLALNNIAQDNTYMKDYVTYQMMNAMGADAPLSSFIWVTVNGEDWGLYLAAEGVEESFAQRVYGNNYGEIYKPDSMDMGDKLGGEVGEGFPGRGQMPEWSGEMPQLPETTNGQEGNPMQQRSQMPNFRGNGFGTDSATSLIYSDDDPDSYAAIFDNAVFDTSSADKARLISSLKQLNAGENIDQIVDVDEVIRYFVVHNFVLNSDSYTGSMIHNYYLAENDGKLSMIAWDYNLAFGGMGGFGGGMGGRFGNTNNEKTDAAADSVTSLVNYPIDSPMLSGSTEDKPMIGWIFDNEEYRAKYHEVFAEYMEYFNSGKFSKMYDNAIALISPYIEKDPSAFCTYEEFQKGSTALREFCLRRSESINGQLNGTIAATSQEQTATAKAGFIDASDIDMESMGSNSMGFGGARGGEFFGGSLPAAIESTGQETPDTAPQNKGDIKGRKMANTGIPLESSVLPISANEGMLMLICMVLLIAGILFVKRWRRNL